MATTTIDPTNSVTGTFTVFTGDRVLIKRDGFIHAGTGTAIEADGSARVDNVEVVVEGALRSVNGSALSLSGYGNILRVSATGSMSSGAGVGYIGTLGTVVNEGTISVNGGGGSTALAANRAMVLYNTGTIRNDGYGADPTETAIRGGSGDDIITNAGFIQGVVSLQTGNDIYDGRGGILNGIVLLSYGKDKAYGGAGSETFDPGIDDDFVDGGGGDDTVVFSGARANYTIAQNADGSLKVTDGRIGKDGSDILKNVEFLRFSDQTIDLRPPVVSNPQPQPLPQPLVVNQVLAGSKGKDVLAGGAGNDKLIGGYGNDVLTGAAGQDSFVFNARLGTDQTDRKVNFDTITDFKPGEDKILLDNAIFKKLGKGSDAAPGALSKSFFKNGAPKDKNDYLSYSKGVLSYDADGNGTQYKAVEILKLANKASLSAADFMII